jgi:hypothetical protein
VSIRLTIALASIAICIWTAKPASAQVDPWEFEVYPYATDGRGVMEMSTDNAVVANGHHTGDNGTASGTFPSQSRWYNEYEFNYGLTDRVEGAFYLTLSQVSGHGMWYAGSKYRLHGRLFDEETLPVNLGWYAELEWHQTPRFDGSDLELELKPIIEKDFGPLSIVLNPKFEKSLAGDGRNQGFEFGYAAGTYYRWTRYLSPGIEYYGGIGLIDDSDPLSAQQHYIFPVIRGELPGQIEYNVGPGFGLSRGSDRVIIKFNIELERFVGALFGTSPEKGWFF